MKKIQLPDTLVIISAILLLFLLLTWIIPAGEFEREKLESGREVIVQGSYHRVEQAPQGIKSLFTAPLRGFAGKASIIGFILFVGGAFSVVNRTGAIRAGLHSIVRFCHRKPQYKGIVIPIIMTMFSICGATFGMSEETLVFILVTIPLALSLGYDAIVGVAIPFVGAGMGFAGAFLNPFTVQIAQGIAGIPLLSGWEYRLIVWAIFTFIGIVYVMSYAKRIEKNPDSSAVAGISTRVIEPSKYGSQEDRLTMRRKIILLAFGAAIVLLIIGASFWGWYIQEITGLFIGLAIFSALTYGLSINNTVRSFYDGASDLIAAGMIVAMSHAILEVATEGKIIDSILYGISNAAAGLHPAISVEVMFWVQSLINFFVPSGSGQAALTMPIMAPLGETLGLQAQVTVLAYQFGDGLSNLIIPTSYVTMGILAIAKIPYEKWLKWSLPLMIILFLTAMLLLLPPVLLFEYQ